MRRTRGNTQMQENHENAFNLSISDLMAGMLSIFILAVCYFMLNLGQVKDQYMGNNAKRDQLLEEIQEEMMSGESLLRSIRSRGFSVFRKAHFLHREKPMSKKKGSRSSGIWGMSCTNCSIKKSIKMW